MTVPMLRVTVPLSLMSGGSIAEPIVAAAG